MCGHHAGADRTVETLQSDQTTEHSAHFVAILLALRPIAFRPQKPTICGAVDRLCKHHDMAVAIVNPGDAYVLGGAGDALDSLADEAKAIGAARVVRVAVNVASHTPRLAAASAGFRKVLGQTPVKSGPDMGVRLLSGIDGSSVVDIQVGKDKLALQISHTAEWAACLQAAWKREQAHFLNSGQAGRSVKWL